MRNENEQKGKKNCYSLTITKMREEKFKQNNNEIESKNICLKRNRSITN